MGIFNFFKIKSEEKNKLIIINLEIETTLEDFINDWDLDVDKVNERLENSKYYEDDYVLIESKGFITIKTEYWETIDKVNKLYDNNYFLVVKDVYFGENDYTKFTIECPKSKKVSDIFFEGGEYDKKNVLNKNQIFEFLNLLENGKIDTNVSFQEVWIIKKNNLIDNGWEKTIKSFKLYDWDKYSFESYSNIYKNNKIFEELNNEDGSMVEVYYLTGLKEIIWKGYSDKGILEEVGIYNNIKKKEGNWKFYWENGQLCDEGFYKNDERDGSWKSYYENGQLCNEGFYKNDDEQGYWKGYYINGQLKYEGIYNKGLNEGLWKFYDDNGEIESIKNFKNGEILK